MKILRKKPIRALGVVVVVQMLLGCAPPGFLGLQDYQRDLLFGFGGGLAAALIGNAANTGDGGTGSPAPGVPGPQGPQGLQGPAGPAVFSVFVDTFFEGEFDALLGVVPVRNDNPQFAPGGDPIAFSTTIPNHYDGAKPINMRLMLYRSGPCTGDCFILSVDARRLDAGGGSAECFGGSGADCEGGTRWVRVADTCDGAADRTEFIVVDLSLSATGLDFPEPKAGDFLAFELNTFSDDGGTYDLLSVEFSNIGDAGVANADVFMSLDDIPAECAP